MSDSENFNVIAKYPIAPASTLSSELAGSLSMLHSAEGQPS
jgi:hypothetical protein